MTLTLDLPDEMFAAVKSRAEAEGTTAERWLRRVVEEHLRLAEADDRPVSEMFREIWAGMPEEILAGLPEDGASQVDHYVYGLPKKKS